MSGFDFIGDVHGCCGSLIALLDKLGYQKRNGVYQHPERQAVFLGDLVDRGPQIRETLHLVRNMVDQGHAQMVLGNHEIGVLRYLTPARPGSGREFLREHTERATFMVAETLRQFEQHQAELDEFLHWFYQVPLFIEHERFRVVHACWDHQHIQHFLEQYRQPYINEEMMHQPLASKVRQTIELLTRGTNMTLPLGEKMITSDGFSRRSFRAKFWHENPRVYGDLAFQPDPLPEHLYHYPLTDVERAESIRYTLHERPLFVGHYWCQGDPRPINDNIACVDYSAINGGKLVAYRMGQESRLDKANFVWVDACD